MPFVVAVPFRSVCDDQARVLDRHGLLRLYATWNRRGTAGIPSERTKLLPPLGLLAYVGARTLSPYWGEAFRFSLYPFYDAWVKALLKPGDHVISSYAYANASFRWAKRNGGKSFLDGGNSHPANFWEIMESEHRRWNCPYPPVARFYYRRSMEMMESVDYILSPSSFVKQSFLARGFRADQILDVFYPLELSLFAPDTSERPTDRPFTIVNTAGLSLRKGTPYLLEAFRLIRARIPNARLLLTDVVADSMRPLMARYADLPIEWAPSLAHPKLAARLRSADLFILPSLEEGLVRTALEAMGCGIPAILTPNTGTADHIEEGINGSIVPIRDPAAIADRACFWWEKIRAGYRVPAHSLRERFSAERLEPVLLGHLRSIGLA